MGAYVIRRLLLFVPMLVAISVIAFILIQLPSGDYLTSEIMAMAERGEEVDEAAIAALELRYGLNRPMVEQYFRWITNIIFEVRGRLRALLPLEAAGVVADLGTADVDGGNLVRQPAVHLGGGVPDRHLLGHQPVLDRRLPVHLLRLSRQGHAQLPAGAGADVAGLRLLRLQHGRPVLGRVPEGALEPGQAGRP